MLTARELAELARACRDAQRLAAPCDVLPDPRPADVEAARELERRLDLAIDGVLCEAPPRCAGLFDPRGG